jgi:hypothetical protein
VGGRWFDIAKGTPSFYVGIAANGSAITDTRSGQEKLDCSRIRLLFVYKKALSLGGDLLSQSLAGQVSSALVVFASVFGMGTGGSPPHKPPRQNALLYFQF